MRLSWQEMGIDCRDFWLMDWGFSVGYAFGAVGTCFVDGAGEAVVRRQKESMMRLIALSIVILAGSLMAAAGAIADALPGARQYSQLPLFGLLLVGAAGVMFVIEWWPTPVENHADRRAASRSSV